MAKNSEKIKIILGLAAIGLIMALSYIIFPSTRRPAPSPSGAMEEMGNYIFNNKNSQEIEAVSNAVNEETDNYIINIQYPAIKGLEDKAELENLNQRIKDFISSPMGDFKAQAEKTETPEGMKNGLYITYEATYLSKKIESIKFNVSEYYSGAAHPGNYVLTFNYDIDKNQEIALKDLFSPEADYLSFLSNFSRKTLSSRFQDNESSMQDWINSGTEPEEGKFQHFTFGKDGLTIYFDPYQIGPYALGVQKVNIPFKDLRGYVNPEYEIDA